MKKALPTLPVRSIGVSGRSVTGIVPLMGRFESTLERDLMELVRFDRRVSSFLPVSYTHLTLPTIYSV